MKKQFFVLLMCSMGFFARSAEIKIALIGDSPEANKVADLVLVELSNDSELELLERRQIEAVLKERKLQTFALTGRKLMQLSQILHTDILAIISSGSKKATPVGLKVFNAKNGFIILDTALSAGSITSQKDFISQHLKKSLKAMSKNQLCLAVLTIRNAGVDASLFYSCVGLTANISRVLASSPDIAMLERANLDMVNRERKIVEKHYSLANATILIDFEFLPMDTPKKIEMHTRILNRQGKVLKTFSYKNINKNNSVQKNASSDILAFLKVKSGKISYPSAQEAKRFYQEFSYIRRIDFNEARRNITAAIALDPKQLNYRKEFAYLLMDEAKKNISPKNENSKYFKMLRHGLQILSEIRKESPNYQAKNLFSAKEGIFTSFSNRYYDKIIPEELIKCASIFRRYKLNEMLIYYPTKLNKNEAFSSIEELKNYCDIIGRIHNFNGFLSKELKIKSYFENLNNYLDRSKAFFVKHPELLKTMTPKKQIRLGLWKRPLRFTFSTSSKLFFKVASQQAKTIVKMKQHPLTIIKTNGALLELYANLYKNDFSVEFFKHDIVKYFNYIKPLFPSPKITDRRTIYLWSRWQDLSSDLRSPQRFKLCSILTEQSCLFMLKQNMYNTDQIFAYILNAKKNRNEFLKRVMVLTKIKKMKHIGSYNSSHALLRLKMYMKKVKVILVRYAKKKLYNDLEVAVGIKKAKPVSMVKECLLAGRGAFWKQGNGNNRIIAAELFKNKVYFCFLDLKRIRGPQPFEYSLSLGCLDIKTKWAIKISSYKGYFKNSRFGQFYNSLIYKGRFYLACKEGVLVFSLNGSKPYMIDKLPAEYVYTIAGLNGRIYIVLQGKDNSNGNTPPPQLVLISCKPDGNDRKIIFSSRDRQKRNVFDRDKAFRIEYIWGDEKKNRLLILACKPFGGLWEFYPETNKAKSLCNLSPFPLGWGKYMNGKLYFSMSDSVYFEYNPENNRTRFLYCNAGRKSYYMHIVEKHCKLKAETIQKHSARFRKFYKADKYLWYGHDWSMWRMDLNNPKNPMRFDCVRNTNSEFPILAVPGKKAVIAVSSKEIFYLGEKEGEQIINPSLFKHPLLKKAGF